MSDVNKGAPEGPYFKSALDRYERIGSAADDAVGLLFSHVSKNCSSQFDAVALKTLNDGQFSTGPLAYLQRCASSNEMLHAIEQASVPATAVASKNMALIEIRRRLGNGGK